jgi:hypothetical protein
MQPRHGRFNWCVRRSGPHTKLLTAGFTATSRVVRRNRNRRQGHGWLPRPTSGRRPPGDPAPQLHVSRQRIAVVHIECVQQNHAKQPDCRRPRWYKGAHGDSPAHPAPAQRAGTRPARRAHPGARAAAERARTRPARRAHPHAASVAAGGTKSLTGDHATIGTASLMGDAACRWPVARDTAVAPQSGRNTRRTDPHGPSVTFGDSAFGRTAPAR